MPNGLSIEARCRKLLDTMLPDYLACPILVRIMEVSPALLGKHLQEPPHPIAAA